MNEFFNTREIEMDPTDVNANKVVSILGYLGILFLIPLLVAKDSPFAKFHANQGLLAFLVALALNTASGLICTILGILHLGTLSALVAPLIGLVTLAFTVLGIINVAQGKAKELPLIGQFHLLDSENAEKSEKTESIEKTEQ